MHTTAFKDNQKHRFSKEYIRYLQDTDWRTMHIPDLLRCCCKGTSMASKYRCDRSRIRMRCLPNMMHFLWSRKVKKGTSMAASKGEFHTPAGETMSHHGRVHFLGKHEILHGHQTTTLTVKTHATSHRERGEQVTRLRQSMDPSPGRRHNLQGPGHTHKVPQYTNPSK